MIDKDWAHRWAQQWIDAFNSHSLTTILALYDEHFEMHSPYIIERMGEASGCLIGKTAITPYWEKSLQTQPALQFELIDVFVGVNQLTIHYHNIGRKMVCESFRFNADNQVIWACSQHGQATT